MDKRFWTIIGVIVALFAGILWINQGSQQDNTTTDNKTQPTSHIKGKTPSSVTLVEYGDFQCSACKSYYYIVKDVIAQYEDKVAFQFRHLPLNQIHRNAFAAARAAEAASNQNKFWEMYDLLYENQDPSASTGWAASNDPLNNYFASYAKQLNLDSAQFKQDFSSASTNNKINADKNEFNKTGLPAATPTFLLNGKHIDFTTAEELSKLLDKSLEQ